MIKRARVLVLAATLVGSSAAILIPQAAHAAAKPTATCVNNADGITFTVTVTKGVKSYSYTSTGTCPSL